MQLQMFIQCKIISHKFEYISLPLHLQCPINTDFFAMVLWQGNPPFFPNFGTGNNPHSMEWWIDNGYNVHKKYNHKQLWPKTSSCVPLYRYFSYRTLAKLLLLECPFQFTRRNHPGNCWWTACLLGELGTGTRKFAKTTAECHDFINTIDPPQQNILLWYLKKFELFAQFG